MAIFDDPNWLQGPSPGGGNALASMFQGQGSIAPQMPDIAGMTSGIQPQTRTKRSVGNVLSDFFSGERLAKNMRDPGLAAWGDLLGNIARVSRGEDPSFGQADRAFGLQDRDRQQADLTRADETRNAFAQLLIDPSQQNQEALAPLSPETLYNYRNNEQSRVGDQREAFGNALMAIEQSENPAETWMQVAATAGLDPQMTERVAQQLQQGQSPTMLARAMGYEPPRQGSLPGAVQNYAMYQEILNTQGQEAADEFMRFAVPSQTLSPAQAADDARADAAALRDQRRLELAEEEAGRKATEPVVGAGQKELDKAFGKDYADYIASGGFADIQKGIEQLREAKTILQDGGVTGGITGYLPTVVRGVINEPSVSVQESIEEVVQRNLRLILGAQFTQREGERLISRAFNPRLSEGENIKRLDRLMSAMERAAEAKNDASEYFEQNGTLQGWKGTLYSAADFESVIDGKVKARTGKAPATRGGTPARTGKAPATRGGTPARSTNPERTARQQAIAEERARRAGAR